jgi:sortase A
VISRPSLLPRLPKALATAGVFAVGYLAFARLRQAVVNVERTKEDSIVPGPELQPADPPAPAVETSASTKSGRRTRRRRRLGIVLIVLGVMFVGYAAAVVFWRDPATDLYARWRQHELGAELDSAFAAQKGAYAAVQSDIRLHLEASASAPTVEELLRAEQVAVARAANKAHRKLKLGKPLGRIKVPRMGLKAVFVQGTRWGPDLSQGPGHYAQTSLPGVGRTAALAGHRTTFGAPFRHIDSLRPGDRIELSLAYATFHYRVFGHKIVDNDDWSIIRDRGFDTLVLSACHPLYSAAQRWVVFARLHRVDPVGGRPYRISKSGDLHPVT